MKELAAHELEDVEQFESLFHDLSVVVVVVVTEITLELTLSCKVSKYI